MRTDLSAQFEAKKNATGRTPRTLAVFHFDLAGDIYLSDVEIGTADGLDNDYQPLILDFGTLNDIASGDPTDDNAGETRAMNITLWNGGADPFSNKFLVEEPENVTVDIYQWFAGLTDGQKSLIDTFVIQDPIKFDERSFQLHIGLVSLSMRYDQPVGDIITEEDWPNAATDHIGESIPLIFGSVTDVPTLIGKTSPRATLSGSVLSGTMVFQVNENLDDLNFPASGIIQIGAEKAVYSSRTDAAFNISQRGWKTTKTEHLDQSDIVLFITDHTYIVGKGSIGGISNIKVGGFPAAAPFTTDTTADPARIIFSEKPYSVGYAKGSTFIQAQFDGTNADNTALQPHLAYDPESEGTAAITNGANDKLSLKRSTALDNQGEIVKAYVSVEHYESGIFLNDQVEVSVSGIGVVGILKRPNPNDVANLEAEVDIDHGHAHAIAGEHTHTFTPPSQQLVDATHGHGVTGVSSTTTHYPTDQGFSIYRRTPDELKYIYPVGAPAWWDSASLIISCSNNFASIGVKVYTGTAANKLHRLVSDHDIAQGGSVIVGVPPAANNGDDLLTLVVYIANSWFSVGSRYVDVSSIGFEATQNSTVQPSGTGVTLQTLSSGGNADALGKHEDDVDDLLTDNVPISVTNQNTATRSAVDLFDITSEVNFDWSWFTDREIYIEYQGNNDSKNVYILNAFFDIEFRKKEVVFSDAVTCDVSAVIDDDSGTYTGTAGALITRPDHCRKYILCELGGMSTTRIDSISFNTAGAIYAANGYSFNGLIDGSTTVRQADKMFAQQSRSRFFWNAGKAKIQYLQSIDDMTVDKAITANDIRLRSMAAARRPVRDLANRIRVNFNRKWTEDDNFKSIISREDSESISQHGVLENRSGFKFDLVTAGAMAESLADFYLERRKTATTFYSFETYLNQFELEKGDVISVEYPFAELNKANMVIRAIDRVYGSGKNKLINTLRVTAEVLRYILHKQNNSDTINTIDNISFEWGFNGIYNEVISGLDSLSHTWGKTYNDMVTANDVLSILFIIAETINESVTTTDTLAASYALNLGDAIKVSEQNNLKGRHGFGGGYFGMTEFGGPGGGLAEWEPEESIVTDQLSSHIYFQLSEGAGVSDVNSLADGFGNMAFGQGGFGTG